MARNAAMTSVTVPRLHSLLAIDADLEIRDLRIDWVRNRVEILLVGDRLGEVLANCEPRWVPFAEVATNA